MLILFLGTSVYTLGVVGSVHTLLYVTPHRKHSNNNLVDSALYMRAQTRQAYERSRLRTNRPSVSSNGYSILTIHPDFPTEMQTIVCMTIDQNVIHLL